MRNAYRMPKRNAYASRMQAGYAESVTAPIPVHARRQANLLLLIEEAGGVASLSRLADSPRSHLSALSNGSKTMGHQLAAKLERATGKEPGWMDADHSAAPTEAPRSSALAAPQAVRGIGDVVAELGRSLQQLPPTRRRLIAAHASEVLERGPEVDTAETLNELGRGIGCSGGLLPPDQVGPELAEFMMIAKQYADQILESGLTIDPARFILDLQAHRAELVAAYRAQQAEMAASATGVHS